MNDKNHQIYRLIRFFGGQVKTAEALGVEQPAVSNWLNNRNKINTFNAQKAEKLTNGEIKATELCPELAELEPA